MNIQWQDSCDGLFETINLPMPGNHAAIRQMQDAWEGDFRSLAESSPNYIIRYDRDGLIRYLNSAMVTGLGLNSAEEVIDKRPSEAWPDGRFNAIEGACMRAVESGTIEVLELTQPFGLGELQYHQVRIAPERDVLGHIIGTVAFGSDITTLKRMEHDLLEQKAFQSTLLEAMNDLVERIPVGVFKLRTRPNGQQSFEYVSPRWCEINGLAQADVLRDTHIVLQQMHPDDLKNWFHQMQKAIHAFQSFEWEGQISRQGGSRWLLIQATPKAQNNGDILWNGIVHDVTERHMAEELHRLTASIFASSNEGIVITDAHVRIVEVNHAFCRITGYEREEILGQNPSMLKSGCQERSFYSAMWRDIKQKGYWSGEVWNRRKDGEVYAESLTISAVRNNLGKITHYAGVFADITNLKEQEQQLQKIVHFDALTGMPNRALLADRLGQAVDQARRTGNQIAVCYLDLDDFTSINEQLGHQVGDSVLMEMARRMENCLRDSDTVARISGDEFVLLLPSLKQISECEATLYRILEAIQQPVSIQGQQIIMSASLGVTIYPGDSADPDTLLRHADQAMYLAKQEGKNRYHMHNPEQDRQVKARRESVLRLATAHQHHEFVLYYQPKVDLTTGAVIGVEALIRWQHPERGLLPPSEFLPLIDRTELAIDVGEWVINTALTQIATWKAAGLRLTVSVNISTDHLVRPGFAQQLRAILSNHPGICAKDMELEILESAAISDMEYATQALETVSKMGFGFALDDFGTGYSSLSYFRKLPVDTLKIDQNFVRDMLVDPEDLSIVESIILLAKTFNRPAVAEGVESMAHYAMLLHLGCSFGQGYGIARPMSAEKIPAWIEEWQKNTAWLDVPRIPLPREDVALLVAKSSHYQWINDVVDCMSDPECASHFLNKRQCRFGRWFLGNGYSRYGHLDGFLALQPMYTQINTLVTEMMELIIQGASQDAYARLSELYRQRDRFQEGMDALITQITQVNCGSNTDILIRCRP
ncbi:MAG: diguanylate cyclase/phosphodiesterase with PAS/PAC sensor(s) [Comamonadaceae bacterium]|nr:MAG: diguanylate cyclase/phosphodiesterase with PAS/PAC sensor(s) [Comamonadaceae bacterium]